MLTSAPCTSTSIVSNGDTPGRSYLNSNVPLAWACGCSTVTGPDVSTHCAPSRRQSMSPEAATPEMGSRKILGRSNASELERSAMRPFRSVPEHDAGQPGETGDFPLAANPSSATSALSVKPGKAPARSRDISALSERSSPLGARPAQGSKAGGAKASTSGQASASRRFSADTRRRECRLRIAAPAQSQRLSARGPAARTAEMSGSAHAASTRPASRVAGGPCHAGSGSAPCLDQPQRAAARSSRTTCGRVRAASRPGRRCGADSVSVGDRRHVAPREAQARDQRGRDRGAHA